MPITANNPNRKSWLEVASESDFPIQNIPFGVFLTKENVVTVGTRIGDFAIDLGALQQLDYFNGIELTDDNLYISGNFKGTTKFDDKIVSSINGDFFIWNLKKNIL